jgi:hypothetical protein
MAKRRDDDEWGDESYDDLRDSMDHESEDAEDIEDTEQDEKDQARFSSDTAYCPECSAEISDDADICPKCFTWIDGATHSRPSRLRRSFRVGVVILVLAGVLFGCAGLYFGLRMISGD